MKDIPRKDRAFGVWHTKKQKGNRRQHKGKGGGRQRHRYMETTPVVKRREAKKK